MTYKCPVCGKDNAIVNQCGCDPNNLPTRADEYFVKAREKGKRVWRFITPKLTLNRLRIHASIFTREEAERSATEWAKQDERYEFKAVPAIAN